MPEINSTTTTIIIVLLIFLFLLIFKSSLKFIIKLAFNTLIGFVLLFLFNKVGALIGVSLALNWTNAIVSGVFGLAGIALLLILQWLTVI